MVVIGGIPEGKSGGISGSREGRAQSVSDCSKAVKTVTRNVHSVISKLELPLLAYIFALSAVVMRGEDLGGQTPAYSRAAIYEIFTKR